MAIELPGTSLPSKRDRPLPPLPISIIKPYADSDITSTGHLFALLSIILAGIESAVIASYTPSPLDLRKVFLVHLGFVSPVAVWLILILVWPSRHTSAIEFLRMWTGVMAGMCLAVAMFVLFNVPYNGVMGKKSIFVGGLTGLASLALFALQAEQMYRRDAEIDGGMFSPIYSDDDEDDFLDEEKGVEMPGELVLLDYEPFFTTPRHNLFAASLRVL